MIARQRPQALRQPSPSSHLVLQQEPLSRRHSDYRAIRLRSSCRIGIIPLLVGCLHFTSHFAVVHSFSFPAYTAGTVGRGSSSSANINNKITQGNPSTSKASRYRTPARFLSRKADQHERMTRRRSLLHSNFDALDGSMPTDPDSTSNGGRNSANSTVPMTTACAEDQEQLRQGYHEQHRRSLQNIPGFQGVASVVETIFAEAPPVSILLLNLVAVIWGSQHAIIKTVVDSDAAGAGPFTFLRFGVATLVAARYIPGLDGLCSIGQQQEQQQGETAATSEAALTNSTASVTATSVSNTWRWGIELGLWMFLGFGFQAVGLASTTAQRSGFLLYLNVKFVPIFARLLFGRKISTPTWASAVAAFVGTAMLAFDGTAVAFNQGDLWSIAAAASSAMFILRLESASRQVDDSAGLNAASLCIVTLLAGLWTLIQTILMGSADAFTTIFQQLAHISTSHPLEVLYLGGITTALANYIQTKAQKDVSAERASVIYSMDPVYGAVFSYLMLGETLGAWPSYVGASIVFVAAASNVFLDFGGKSKKTDSDMV